MWWNDSYTYLSHCFGWFLMPRHKKLFPAGEPQPPYWTCVPAPAPAMRASDSSVADRRSMSFRNQATTGYRLSSVHKGDMPTPNTWNSLLCPKRQTLRLPNRLPVLPHGVLVNSMEHHYLGTRYLFGTGGAVLAAENTHYLLFHRIGQPYLYVQAVESSFLLS